MLPATTATPPRIYYAGRHGRQHVGHASQYGIGALEYLDGDWRRTGAPLLMGTPDRPSVLEPRVVLANGTYIGFAGFVRHRLSVSSDTAGAGFVLVM